MREDSFLARLSVELLRALSIMEFVRKGKSADDLNFGAVFEVPAWNGRIVATDGLKQVESSYLINFGRAMLPAEFVLRATAWGGYTRSVATKVQAWQADHPQADHEEVMDAVMRFSREVERPAEFGGGDLSDLWLHRTSADVKLIAWLDSAVMQGIELVFAAMLVNAWTAFESLASDIWEQAVNLRPDVLGDNAIKIGNDGKDLGETGTKSETRRFIRRLIDEQVDVPVGTLLRMNNKFDFARYDGIQQAYKCAFPDGDKAKKLMETAPFQDLIVLEAIRNVLVHSGGRADRQFASRARMDKTIFSKFELDEIDNGVLLELNGAIARDLLTAVVNASKALLGFVDEWFKSNA